MGTGTGTDAVISVPVTFSVLVCLLSHLSENQQLQHSSRARPSHALHAAASREEAEALVERRGVAHNVADIL